MIELHSNKTPNSYKPAIMLEEVGFEYEVVHYDILKGEHLTPEFRSINPNCKLPAIVDRSPQDGGAPLPVFESGAILIYLAEKSAQLLPVDMRERTEVLQWLVWQVAGLGPMHGQAHHFVRYAPEGQAYATSRYIAEAKRLLAVMERRLEGRAYLTSAFSIADIACWPFVNITDVLGIDLATEFPSVHRWWAQIVARPAVRRVTQNAELATPASLLHRRMMLTAQEWSNVFGDRMLTATRL